MFTHVRTKKLQKRLIAESAVTTTHKAIEHSKLDPGGEFDQAHSFAQSDCSKHPRCISHFGARFASLRSLTSLLLA